MMYSLNVARVLGGFFSQQTPFLKRPRIPRLGNIIIGNKLNRPRKEYMEVYRYRPSVLFQASDRAEALRHSIETAAMKSIETPPRLVMFTDGSARNNFTGFSVNYKRSYGADNDWVDMVYAVHGIKSSYAVELLAINRAMWTAVDEIKQWIHRNLETGRSSYKNIPKVIIFSDCQGAMRYVYKRYSGTKPILKCLPGEFSDRILDPLEGLLELGCRVEIHWTPGHSKDEGNHRADKLASIGSGYATRVSSILRLAVENALLPFPELAGGPKMVYPIHAGTPSTVTMHWRKRETQNVLKSLVGINTHV